MIEAVGSRLLKWKNKQLPIVGQIVLIKSVFCVLLVYYLFFFKAPGIISKLEYLFKQFLWGGSEHVRKINWVKWERPYSIASINGA